MRIPIFFAILLFSINNFITAQEPSVHQNKMQWFNDAKLGIFIHYGIYSVNGIPESWSFYNGQISYEDYMKQLDGFTASKYDPDKWAELFSEAGARYAVLTSKHHDGVALWDTKQSDLNVVDKSPAAKDLVAPFASAMREKGIKVGLYFSILDWSHPDYATIHNGPYRVPDENTHPNDLNPFDYPPDSTIYPERWANFLKFRDAQMAELNELVHPDIWWFDGDWSHTSEQWKMPEFVDMVRSWNPSAILNSRLRGHGDYATPEQGVPIVAPEGPWEFCMTTNDSWGFQHKDKNYKSSNYIIRIFADCISMGGNLLLNIGPKEDGTLAPEQIKILKDLGRWTRKHSEAIYATVKGIPGGHFNGPTTLSKNRQTLYCFSSGAPLNGLLIKGIYNEIKNIKVVGFDKPIEYKRIGANHHGGVIQVEIPKKYIDKDITVVAIEFDSPLKLYRGKGAPIEVN